MFSGVALSKPAGGEGRISGKLLLQSYLLPQSLANVYPETNLSREEGKPLLLCKPVLSVLHMKGLAVVLVGDLFNAEQKGRCVSLIRAALPHQWCLWREGVQVLAHCMPCIWPSAGVSPSPYKAGWEAGLMGLYLFVGRKDCLTPNIFFHCWILCHVYAICC